MQKLPECGSFTSIISTLIKRRDTLSSELAETRCLIDEKERTITHLQSRVTQLEDKLQQHNAEKERIFEQIERRKEVMVGGIMQCQAGLNAFQEELAGILEV